MGRDIAYISALAQRLFPTAFLRVSCFAQGGKKINQQINKWQSASLITAASQTAWRILPGDNAHIQLLKGARCHEMALGRWGEVSSGELNLAQMY